MAGRAKTPSNTRPSSTAHEKAESDALFLSIGEGAIVTDARGNISRINNTALKILGLTEGEAMGKWYPDTLIAEDEAGNLIPNIDRPITQVFLAGRSIFKKMYYRRRDGSRIAVALTVSPVLLKGKPIGAIQIFRDITEEVTLDHAKDEFISLASHQLRTPATAVKQYAGMLVDGYAGDLTTAQLAMVQTIYDVNERQITIINDLLRVAQVDAGQVQLDKMPVALTPLIQDIITEQAHKFVARSQKINFTHPAKEVWAHVDGRHMRMVIENLVDNASKYTPSGRRVFVVLQSGKWGVRIKVKDEGVGIPKASLGMIFEKFTRLDNPLSTQVGGTGLGLYWVKKIIDLHGAALDVRSRPDAGSTFTIILPEAISPIKKDSP